MFTKVLSFGLLLATSCNASTVPALRGPVNDYAKALRTEEQRRLEKILLREELTTGKQVVILTVKRLNGQSIDELALRFFNKHGLGRKSQDDGVLIVAAIEDRQLRIEVGYGLEAVLTDALCTFIRVKLINPAFAQGKYFEGLSAGIQKIFEIIKTAPIRPVEPFPLAHSFLLLLLGLILLSMLIGRAQTTLPGGFESFWGWTLLFSLAFNLLLAPNPANLGLLEANLVFLFATLLGLTLLAFSPLRILVGLGLCAIFAALKAASKNAEWRIGNHYGSSGRGSSGSGGGYSGGGGRSGGGGSSGGW